MYKIILIDADDTLFDYEKAEKYALEGVFNHYGFYGNFNVIRDKYKTINTQLWLDLEKSLITKDELKYKRFELLFNEFSLKYNPVEAGKIYLKFLGESNFLIQGAYEFCKYISEKYCVIIVTNGIKDIQLSRIGSSKIKDFIHHVVISDDIGVAKPDYKIFEYALNILNHQNKSEVIMIGDSLSSDIKGAFNFGIDSCWYNIHNIKNQSGLNPKYEISSLDELYEIL